MSFAGLLALATAAVATPACATIVPLDPNDPQIFVQQSGNAPAGGDPNIITGPGSFVIGVAGNFTLQDPLLVIVGVYDGSGTPSITFPGVTSAAVGTYGLTANTANFTSGDAYDVLGLASGGSESFVNWSAADVANGFAAPSSFTLYAFALPTNLTSGSPITIGESGAANGSFIIAYSCNDGTGTNGPDGGCATNGDIGQTPFTNSGLLNGGTSSVPEPVTLALLGVGLIGVGLFGLRRRSA